MAPLEKADHHFKAGYTFPQEGENQEAWTVPNPEGIFSLENMSWPTERCLPLARGALTEPQAPAHCASPGPPHTVPELTRRAWLSTPAEAVCKGTQQCVLQGHQAPHFRIFTSQLLCFAP